MNPCSSTHPPLADYNRRLDAAKARAAQLRNQAIGQSWDDAGRAAGQAWRLACRQVQNLVQNLVHRLVHRPVRRNRARDCGQGA